MLRLQYQMRPFWDDNYNYCKVTTGVKSAIMVVLPKQLWHKRYAAVSGQHNTHNAHPTPPRPQHRKKCHC